MPETTTTTTPQVHRTATTNREIETIINKYSFISRIVKVMCMENHFFSTYIVRSDDDDDSYSKSIESEKICGYVRK
jgi:hypothetical protein